MKKEIYCLVCRDYTNCANCGNKKSRFIKEQQAIGILSNLVIKTSLSKVPLLSILF